MIDAIAKRITAAQLARPWLFIAAFLLITLLLLPGTLRLIGNVEPSLEKVLPQDVPAVRAMNDMRAQFGADMMYLVMEVEGPIQDVRNPSLLEYQNALADKLREREHILEVRTLADIALPHSLDEAREQFTEEELGEYVGPDYRVSVMHLRTDTGASAELIGEVVDAIETDLAALDGMNPGVDVKITGFNAIDRATFEVIISDFQRITLLSMLLVMIVVIVTFRSLRKAMLPMLVVLVALVWTMGIAGYAGLTITVVSMVSAAMIMGLGIDFGIHIVHGYSERRKRMAPKRAITETMQELLRATLGASLTTTAGFLALLAGVLPAMKTLGIILGLGIIVTMTGAVLLLPPVLYLSDNGPGAGRYRK